MNNEQTNQEHRETETSGHSDNSVNTNADTNMQGGSAGTTGTGITAGETGYGERGQLPDTAAPPVAQQ